MIQEEKIERKDWKKKEGKWKELERKVHRIREESRKKKKGKESKVKRIKKESR